MHEDTIAAIATPPGVGGVGIVRVSGPEAVAIADALYRTATRHTPRVPLAARPSHRIHHGWLVDPATEQVLDEALVLVMRGPRSFTGEDVVEFQTHGGPVVLAAVLARCLAQGARLASAGEFTKRAFLNGRLDLTRAEAIADVIQARTERGLSQAIGQLDGVLARAVAATRRSAIGLLARLEASIDYPDEIDDLPAAESLAAIDQLIDEVDARLATARQGQIWREGAALAIVGRPNVGKSSLLNALLGRSRAIVTDVPGTTRDVLEEGLALLDVPFRVLDTAGIRETTDPVEALGVARSREVLAQADVALLVVDLATGVGPADEAIRCEVGDRPLIVVGNKLDLLPSEISWLDRLKPLAAGAPVVAVSAATGTHLSSLVTCIVELALGRPLEQAAPTTVNARHGAVLGHAHRALVAARLSVVAGMAADFVAIDLKEAIAALGEVTGEAIAAEVIDEVFARFCVGK